MTIGPSSAYDANFTSSPQPKMLAQTFHDTHNRGAITLSGMLNLCINSIAVRRCQAGAKGGILKKTSNSLLALSPSWLAISPKFTSLSRVGAGRGATATKRVSAVFHFQACICLSNKWLKSDVVSILIALSHSKTEN